MAVTEGDLDPQGPQKDHNVLVTLKEMSWSCDHVAAMWLILIILLATWLFEAKS